jgi:hypothetical protein
MLASFAITPALSEDWWFLEAAQAVFQKKLDIHDKLDEFNTEPPCRMEGQCGLLPAEGFCRPSFYMATSQSMPKKELDALTTLMTEYSELTEQLNALSGGFGCFLDEIISPPRMKCRIGRCVNVYGHRWMESRKDHLTDERLRDRERLRRALTMSAGESVLDE